MALFIAVLIVMVIMLYFMYVTLKAGIENANRKVNKFFLDKIEEFDEEFDEKIDKIEELTESRDALKRQVKSLKEDMISFKTSPFYAPRPVPRSVYVPVASFMLSKTFAITTGTFPATWFTPFPLPSPPPTARPCPKTARYHRRQAAAHPSHGLRRRHTPP